MPGIFFETERDRQKLMNIMVDKIDVNRYQPRKNFDESQLYELAQSIKEHGILQPLTVRRTDKERYELIAGERRLRAAKLVGLSSVPVIIRNFSDEQSMVLSIIENIQRADLNYFEEAESYKKLIEECHLTQEELAKKLGKTQSSVANKLRLLRLPESVKMSVIENNLTERHARALLKLSDEEKQLEAIKKICEKSYNVNETDEYIDKLLKERETMPETPKRTSVMKDVRIFMNTINRAISVMLESGIKAESSKVEFDDYYEYVIKIPK